MYLQMHLHMYTSYIYIKYINIYVYIYIYTPYPQALLISGISLRFSDFHGSTQWASRFAPFGAFGAMAHTVGKYGIATLGSGNPCWLFWEVEAERMKICTEFCIDLRFVVTVITACFL